MKEISVSELKSKMDNQEQYQLIDIREPHEVDICEIGGEHIPMGDLPANIDKIRKDVPVIIHCRSGARSSNMVNYLESTFGYNNLYNLKGGILAYAKEIDPSLSTY